jgi:DNA modification methylase
MKGHLQVEYRPIESVTPYAQNARIHSDQQIDQIVKSILEVGFTTPILVDENGVVIAGHGRHRAAERIGLKLIPTIRLEDLTPDQIRAYRLADNKICDNAGWDEDLLRIELEYLTSAEVDFSVDLTGFSTPEIDLLLHSDPVPKVEDEPLPAPDPANVVSGYGDTWYLRPHKVSVGDCRDTETIDTLMDGALAQMVLTDPPYNVAIQGHVSGLGKTRHREFPIASGEMPSEEFTEFLTDSFSQFARVSVDGSLHFAFMDWRHMPEILQAGEAAYDRLINLACWVKGNGGMGSLYRSRHELVFIFKRGTASHVNNIQLGKYGRYRTNVWEYHGSNSFGQNREESLTWHPTVKPVALLTDAILDVTHPGDIVLDGFLGSGSTLIAAERAGRACYGIELDPAYVDVTIGRWERETGQQAILAGTNQTFDEVAAERGVQQEVAA